jgi:hypothetical protein
MWGNTILLLVMVVLKKRICDTKTNYLLGCSFGGTMS